MDNGNNGNNGSRQQGFIVSGLTTEQLAERIIENGIADPLIDATATITARKNLGALVDRKTGEEAFGKPEPSSVLAELFKCEGEVTVPLGPEFTFHFTPEDIVIDASAPDTDDGESDPTIEAMAAMDSLEDILTRLQRLCRPYLHAGLPALVGTALNELSQLGEAVDDLIDTDSVDEDPEGTVVIRPGETATWLLGTGHGFLLTGHMRDPLRTYKTVDFGYADIPGVPDTVMPDEAVGNRPRVRIAFDNNAAILQLARQLIELAKVDIE